MASSTGVALPGTAMAVHAMDSACHGYGNMALPGHCYGTAMASPWLCHGRRHGHCHGHYHGHCHGTAMAVKAQTQTGTVCITNSMSSQISIRRITTNEDFSLQHSLIQEVPHRPNTHEYIKPRRIQLQFCTMHLCWFSCVLRV